MTPFLNDAERKGVQWAIVLPFLIFAMLIFLLLGLLPIVQWGIHTGAVKFEMGLMALVGVCIYFLMCSRGERLKSFVKRLSDLVWNLYTMATLYFTFSSAIIFNADGLIKALENFQKHRYLFSALAVGLFLAATLRCSVALYELWHPGRREKKSGLPES